MRLGELLLDLMVVPRWENHLWPMDDPMVEPEDEPHDHGAEAAADGR